ncbi:MAG: hypothetical protein ABMA26_15705 [Limisphaerales bacterium]
MVCHRKRSEACPFGSELHRLLALIGLKRSAFGDRGYTYSLHKQICRGERPPSQRALASLEKLLNHRLGVVLAAARRDPAKLERLQRQLETFTWLRRNSRAGHWVADASALGCLWEGRRPPGGEEGLPILIEGTVIEPKLARPAAALRRFRLKRKRLTLTTTESGETCLTAILSPAAAERLRRALAGG